jgi:arylsulfatase A
LTGYSSQLLVDEAISQLPIDASNAAPFFHFLAFHEPHSPIASPPELTEKYSSFGDPTDEYLANLENLDAAIGRYLAALEARRLANNTIVIFFSDNGPIAPGSAGALRGKKSFVYEGGIRVPAIIRGPGFAQGARTSFPANAVDLFPTLISLLGSTVDCDDTDCAFDGVDLAPILYGSIENHRARPMYWFFYRNKPEAALRQGDFLLLGSSEDWTPRTHWLSLEDLEFIAGFTAKRYELYNVRQDPMQQRDLATQRPELVSSMAALLQQEHRKANKNVMKRSALPRRENWPRKEVWP